MNLAADITQRFKGEVFHDPESLDRYSRDASLFAVRPALVVAPRNAEDVGELVRFASERPGVSLTARSGGTDMSGGPLSESIVVDVTRHLNKILEVGNGYAVAQPGVYYRDFERETLKKGLLMPSYPASREICTIGGIVANNSGGEKTLTYGQTKQYVIGLKVVLADGNEYQVKPLTQPELESKIAQGDFEGNLYKEVWNLVGEHHDFLNEHKPKVSKNSAGYFLWDVWDGHTFDLTKLFTGSQGTLGIITEIKFKLIKPKSHSKLLVIFLNDLSLLDDVALEVLKYKPESFESYDDKTLKIALRYIFNFIKLLGKNVFSLAWSFLPEFKLVLTGGIPKMILMAEFAGDDEQEVARQAEAAQASLARFNLPTHITNDDDESKKYWTIRRESFNLLRKHIEGKRTAPFIDDMVVQPKHLPDFLPKLEKILEPYDLTYSVAGHIGDGNLHIIPLMDIGDERIAKIIPELSKKVYDLILEFHGSITGEHNDGLIRTPFLKQMYGEKMYSLFEKTKQIFDSKGIFNPGKKVGGSFEYAMAHLNTGAK